MNFCEICGCDLGEEDDEKIDHEITRVRKNCICWNCWYETTYNSYNVKDIIIEDSNKDRSNSSNLFTTIEYLLICMECQHQTGYGYLWFAIQDGREHVLSRGHKLVTISEIIWQEDKALEIIRIDIKFLH